ncbi:MAG: hypothetical protein Kow00128_16490 [Deltaproteobacteria bacterium]
MTRTPAYVRPLAAGLAMLVLCLAPGCSRRNGTVEGKARIGNDPAAGAEIRFFVREGEERSGTPFATGESGKDGSFRKELPPGAYFVTARRTAREGGRERTWKGEYPGNPVQVEAGGRTAGIDLPMSEMSGTGFVAQEGTGVTGTVRSGGRPAAGVFVYAYPVEAGTVRGPSFVAFAKTDGRGVFSLPLREGSFRVVARRKGGMSEAGRMEPRGESGGDASRPVTLSAGEMRDLGTIALHRTEEGKRAARASAGGQDRPRARIEGIVLRDDGTPAPGVHVMAYTDHRMIGRPFAISGRTGADGIFRLGLPRPGTFHLGARSGFGGPLSPGEWVGTYDDAPDHAVRVGEGETKTGIRIRVVEKW